MKRGEAEERRLRSAALENARSIFERRRVEEDLLLAKQKLENQSAELAHSLARLRATLESTTDAIVVTDNDGCVTDYNRPFVLMWQIPENELASREYTRVVELNSRWFANPEAYRAQIAAIEESSPTETFDLLELSDGRTVEQVSRPQFIDGHSVGRVWSFRDISGRRRGEREHAYLAAIVTSSNDAIVSKTLDGIITSWNAGAERMFGFSAAEAVGQSISIIIPPDRLDEEREVLSRLRRGERIENYETIRRTREGRMIHASLTISPVKDESGRIIGASKIARDITERQNLLDAERAARTRAEEASRLKDEFLATVSHELRTPLNAILGWAHLLRDGNLDAEKTRHAIEVVERNARTQAQVIEDILDVSRIITGKLRLDVRMLMPMTVVESALESVRPTAEAKGVHLHSVLDPNAGPITGDSSRLQQVYWNLLSNAIKFTPRGGRVEVRLERINSHIEISVSDTGEGISHDFLPHVFDRFRQADASSSRTTGGLGLGLAIVRHLVELHGGLVTAHSLGKGHGATFTVRLPLRPLRSADAKEMSVHPRVDAHAMPDLSGAPRLRDVRVLVVDDEPDARELLRIVLEECGAEVRDAGSVRQALELVRQWSPNVIVSDIGMPGEDGYDLIRQVREWESASGTRIPAVALTAYARVEDRMRALRAGYQVHLSKPIEPMEFVLVVAGAIQPMSKSR
jgi:PAS domain S-box-containing protein